MLRTDQQQRHGQAEAGYGFGQGDEVGDDAGAFETEERAGAAAAGLDIVHDQQSAVQLGQMRYLPQP